MSQTHEELFNPEGVAWQQVSPKLINVRVWSSLAWMLPVLIVLAVLAVIFPSWWWTLGLVPMTVLTVWRLLLIPRQVRALAYCEQEEDLLIREGILFRRMVVVPYGRMQLIDVSAGPLMRKFGIASVELTTASPMSMAKIPGLTPEEAHHLRVRLAQRGEAQLAGL